MSRDEASTTDPTRRDTLKYGSALAVGGFLAGCSTETDDEPESTEADDAPTGNESTGESDSDSGGDATTDSYTVEMAPVGTVEFDSVPEQWTAYDGAYVDMAVALGQGSGVTGVGGADRLYTAEYDELPGVEFDRSWVEDNPKVRTKEEFYALESDVNLYDPQMLINWFDWSQSDVDEIAENVAPFVGNLIFRRSDDWHDYEYYTLYEAFEKIATVFQERERYEAFKSFHDEYIAEIQSRLPPEEERPEVFLTFESTAEPSTFSPYRLDDKGTSKKQWRDLGVKDALEGTDISNLSTTNRGELDYENLLAIDPDVILVRGHERKSPAEFRDVVLSYMRDHPTGSELTAVQNGRVYRGGYLHQGPIHNLFLTERAAQQLFPEEFGEVTSDEQLFDRQRVADIVNGNL
jgi:iron complex transport system substrate-binding protein